ncbi:DUF1641 domain-containing protein [Bacillus sp. RG28]|uniref:DUF1641 domain-containing protein n=1 Tax=Gottfriedia endophytica TaxID=2820819 RepID=A0A940NP47_9BACI|nr:DUF1641 domain-containing protein [Gottfriedia endophytica]MBP0725744.1 DUF1641 domain-containing protein [Gottfriedia endophytica]
MAKPIKQIRRVIPTPEQEREQAITDILTALANNREAVLGTLGIIKQLQDIGVLAALNALLEKRVDVGVIAINQINQPNMHNMIKNGMNAINFLGKVSPDQLQIMLDGVSRGLVRFGEKIDKREKASIWKLGSSIGNDDVKTALVTMLGFLEGMGEVFKEDKQELH